MITNRRLVISTPYGDYPITMTMHNFRIDLERGDKCPSFVWDWIADNIEDILHAAHRAELTSAELNPERER
jgi:hypothetical protein